MALKVVGVSDLFAKLSEGYVSVALGKATISPGNASDYVQRLSAPGAYQHGYEYLSWLWDHGFFAANDPLPSPTSDVIEQAITATAGTGCMDFGRTKHTALTPRSATPVSAISDNDERKGASVVLSLAALQGHAAGTEALKRQLAFTLKDAGSVPESWTNCSESVGGGQPAAGTTPSNSSSNEPTAQGGLSSHGELSAAVTFLVAKRTPAIWTWLSAAQKRKIDLIMRGLLVSNAYITSDHNPEVRAAGAPPPPNFIQHSIDGNYNTQRFWGPSYREGMFGTLLVAQAYFGNQTTALLENFDRSSFLGDVGADGMKLRNLEMTFAPRATGATDAEIAVALTDWKATAPGGQVLRLSDPMALFRWLTEYTYGGSVACGLSDGWGVAATSPAGGTRAGFVSGSGIAGSMTTAQRWQACQQATVLGTSFGKPGMLREFLASDAGVLITGSTPPTTPGGVRSSWNYAYIGFRTNLFTQIGLLAAYGYVPGAVNGTTPSSSTQALWNLRAVGVVDLFRKLDLGYSGYSKGKPELNPGRPSGSASPDDWVLNRTTAPQARYRDGIGLTEDLWNTVLAGSPDAR